MRETKFREWDGESFYYFDNHEWTLSYNDISGWTVYLNRPPIDKQLTIEVELQQYTGLKDKHGVEIYEGDIVRWHDAISPILRGRGGYSLRWKRDAAGSGHLNSILQVWEDGEYNTVLEVVGNIWESPEILESGRGKAHHDDTTTLSRKHG